MDSMLPPDVTLAELLGTWDELAADLESINRHTPDDVADQIVADFADCRDELLKRQRIARMAEALCMGHDGCMYHLGPPGQPPPDLG
jgi:hypothetical protein